MAALQSISQRDLRMRSREIMDTLERGGAFVVTRDGREIGELVPLRQRRVFVPRADFVAMSQGAPVISPENFRADLSVVDDELGDPYAR